MKILILILNVLGFWLIADAAHADPISLAVSAISGFFGSVSIGKLILTVALNVGLSLIEKALTKKEQPRQAGAKLEISMGDDHPMSFVMGSYATAGQRKYAGSWGDDGKTPNAYFTDVIEIGSLPNYAGERGLTSVWIDDQEVGVLWEEPHPDGRGYPVQQYRVGSKDYLWIKFLDGAQSGPDAFLTAKFGTDPDRPWKSTMIGLGCQVIILTARYNTDLFSGIPSGLYQPHPVPLYDIRKDSSAGGNGAHRWDNPATWEPTSNPATMIYNLARGVYYASEWVYGGQNIAAFSLPAANWMAAANACDAAVSLDDGSHEPAFRAGYEIQCDQQPLDVISELLKGCNGRMAEVGGVFKMLISTPGGAVYSFSDDDIVVTEEQDFQPFPSLSDTYNAIEATYPEPSEKWATKDAPGRYNTELEVLDGDRRLPAQIQLSAVPFANQVQRVGLAMIQDYRRFRVHQISLPPDAYPLEPNDVVSWTSERNGYAEKKFLVVKVEPQPNFLTVVTLKEVDPADYDWHSGLQLPIATGWIGPITPPSQPMTGWTVEPATIKDTGGIDRRPAIKISCASDMDDVERVWVQVRLKESGAVVFDSDSSRYESPFSWLISGQWTLSNTDYEARGRYIPKSNRATDWSAWLAVKTPNILISTEDILDDAITAAKIADAAVIASKIMDEAVTNLKLADAAVSTAKLQVAAVTAEVLADQAVIAAKIADGAIGTAKFAAGLKPVEVVTSLPTTGNVEGRQAYLTTDGKLYRYHSGAWIATVDADDIDGTLGNAQIESLAASKITGQLTDTQIAALAAAKVTGTLVSSQISDAAVTAAKIASAALDATKFASNIKPIEVVSTLPTSGNVEGRTVYLTTDDKLYRWTGSAWTAAVPATDVTGQLASTQIADAAITNSKLAALAVDATKLADASVNAAKIASAAIDTTKFASGLRPVEIVSTLPTTGNTEGRMVYLTTDDKLYRYTGSAWISAVASTDITGQLTDSQLAAISAAKLTGQITGTQITDGAISTPKLAAGAVTANEIAAGAVIAGKIAVGAITATEIASGSVTTIKLAAGAVTANELAANSVVAGKIAAGAITATELAAGAVTTAKLAAGAVTASEIAVNAVTVGKIAANAVVAGNVAAQAVTADKMVLADFTNRVENPNFGEGDVSWTKAGSGVSIVNDAANAYIGNWYMSIGVSASGIVGRNSNIFPVIPGEQYFLQAFGKAVGTPNTVLSARMRFLVGDKVTLVSAFAAPSFSSADTSYVEKSATITVPVSAVYAWVDLTPAAAITAGGFAIGFVSCQRKNSSSLIVDGAIIAGKIAANAVTAGNIAANAVMAGTIAANAVTVGTIAAGAVTAAQIAADAITSDKLASNSVTTDALAVGSGKNLLQNVNFMSGLDCWAVGTSGTIPSQIFAIRPAGATWAGPGQPTLMLYQNSAPTGNGYYTDVRWVSPAVSQLLVDALKYGVPCAPGDSFEATAYLSAHRCQVELRIEWRNATGAVVSYTTVAANNAVQGDSGNPDLWIRYRTTGVAPAGAVSACIHIRKQETATGETTSYMFVSKPMLCRIPAGATEVTPWSDGGIVLITNGGIVANAVTAEKVAAGAITTAALAAGSVTAATIATDAVAAASIQAGSVTTAKIATGAITAATIATSAVTAGKIAANAVTAGNIAVNAVTAGTIAAGAVTATELAANSVTAQKLVVQDWENLFPDNQMQTMASWVTLTSCVINQTTTQAFSSAGAIDYIYAAGSGYLNIVVGKFFPVVAAQQYFASIQAIRTSGTTMNFWARIHWFDAAGAGLTATPYTSIFAGGNATTGVQSFSATITAPAGAVQARLYIYVQRDSTDGNISFGGASFLRKANANLIVDGAITAAKIAANAVTTSALAAGSVTATQIAVGAVTAASIAAGTITGDKIAANTIGADQIAANAITAKSLILTDFSNMADNGWSQGNLDGWATTGFVSFANDPNQGDASGWRLISNGVFGAVSNFFPVQPGQQYAFEVWVLNWDPDYPAAVYAICKGSGSDNQIFVQAAATSTKSSWVPLRGKVTIPAGQTRCAMALQIGRPSTGGAGAAWSRPSMRRAVSAELIVDGAVTANAIAANAITASMIQAGAISTDKLVVGGVDYTRIAKNTVGQKFSVGLNDGPWGDGTLRTIRTWSINNDNPNPVLTNFTITLTTSGGGSGNTGYMYLINTTTGVQLLALSVTASAGNSNSNTYAYNMVIEDIGSPGVHSYAIQVYSLTKVVGSLFQFWTLR